MTSGEANHEPSLQPVRDRDQSDTSFKARSDQLRAAGLSETMIAKMIAAEEKHNVAAGVTLGDLHMSEAASDDTTKSLLRSRGEVDTALASPEKKSSGDVHFAQLKMVGLSEAMISKISSLRSKGSPTQEHFASTPGPPHVEDVNNANSGQPRNDDEAIRGFSNAMDEHEYVHRIEEFTAAGFSEAMAKKMVASSLKSRGKSAPSSTSARGDMSQLGDVGKAQYSSEYDTSSDGLSSDGRTTVDSRAALSMVAGLSQNSLSQTISRGGDEQSSFSALNQQHAIRVAQLKASGLSDDMIARMLAVELKKKSQSESTSPTVTADKMRDAERDDNGEANEAVKMVATPASPQLSTGPVIHSLDKQYQTPGVAQLKGSGLSDDVITNGAESTVFAGITVRANAMNAHNPESNLFVISDDRDAVPTSGVGGGGGGGDVSRPRISDEDDARLEELVAAGFSETVAAKMVAASVKSKSGQKKSPMLVSKHDTITSTVKHTSYRSRIKSTTPVYPFDSPTVAARRTTLRKMGLSEDIIGDVLREFEDESHDRFPPYSLDSSHMPQSFTYSCNASKVKHMESLLSAGLSAQLVSQIVSGVKKQSIEISKSALKSSSPVEKYEQDDHGQLKQQNVGRGSAYDSEKPPPEVPNERHTLDRIHCEDVTANEHTDLYADEAMDLQDTKSDEIGSEQPGVLASLFKKIPKIFER
jgi:uncharacterized protein YoaH (UPF0181 family)